MNKKKIISIYEKRLNKKLPKEYLRNHEVTYSIISDIEGFLEENKNATYQDVIDHFGSPEENFEAALEGFSNEELISILDIRTRQFKRIISLLSIVIMLLLFTAIIVRYFL